MLLLLSLSTTTAEAVTFTEYASYLLSPVAGEFYENGLGSPTVVVDQGDPLISGDETYVMLFESMTGAADTDCTAGYWSIGMATSPDGLVWTVADGDPGTAGDDPLFTPGGVDDYYQCVAAHPSAVLLDGTIYVYFKAEQSATEGACSHSWGCSSWVGFGLFALDNYLTTPTVTVTAAPVLVINTSNGKPNVNIVEDTVTVFYQKFPHLYTAEDDVANMVALTSGTLTTNPTTPVVSKGNLSWGPNEIFNSAAMCTDEPATPFINFLGGRKTTGTVGSWGSVLFNTTFGGHADFTTTATWTGTNDWRTWEALMVGYAELPDFLVYFSEKDGSGKPNIALYSTFGATPSWAAEDVSDKICDNTCGL